MRDISSVQSGQPQSSSQVLGIQDQVDNEKAHRSRRSPREHHLCPLQKSANFLPADGTLWSAVSRGVFCSQEKETVLTFPAQTEQLKLKKIWSRTTLMMPWMSHRKTARNQKILKRPLYWMTFPTPRSFCPKFITRRRKKKNSFVSAPCCGKVPKTLVNHLNRS